MRFAVLKRPLGAVLFAGAISLMLAACSDDMDDLDNGAAAGSAFSQSLFKNYNDLATQAAAIPAPASDEDDGFFSFLDVFGSDDNSGNLAAKLFADKALLAQRGEEPDPEAAPDPAAIGLRARLVRDIAAGKAQFPDLSANAQTNFDCWVVYGAMAGQGAAAASCRTQLDGSLARLEAAERPAPPPVAPIASAPIAPLAQAPASADYTVYFDFDSWTLTPEDLSVLTQVIDTARSGGQSRINIVGHTDTSGSADYNQKLSVHRGNVVLEALIDMGARRPAIHVTGVGETDLAVPTADGVKEAKNRRAVITLAP